MNVLMDDWRLLRQSRPSVLLICPPEDVDAAVGAITGSVPEDVRSWRDVMAFPGGSDDHETVLVRDVMTLDAREQEKLNVWLEARGGTVRVIATSPTPLYPLVERQKFLESLYYRLNVVCLEIGGSNRFILA